MNIIEESKNIEFIERKSKFIGYIKNVNTVEEAQKYIKEIRELHPNATHIVPVYRLIENKQEYLKYNDDGEPQGTAAKPMADIIIRKDIYNVVLLAVRYFGGIKLGAGGLIRNYARVAKELVDICTIKEYEEKVYLMLIYDYSRKALIDSLIEKTAAKNIYTSYLDKINTKILVAKSKIQNFDINEVEKIIL